MNHSNRKLPTCPRRHVSADHPRQRARGLDDLYDRLGDIRRLRAAQRRDIWASQARQSMAVGAENWRRQIIDSCGLTARHHLVTALSDLYETLVQILGSVEVVARALVLGDHQRTFFDRAKSQQHVTGTRIEQADLGADA